MALQTAGAEAFDPSKGAITVNTSQVSGRNEAALAAMFGTDNPAEVRAQKVGYVGDKAMAGLTTNARPEVGADAVGGFLARMQAQDAARSNPSNVKTR